MQGQGLSRHPEAESGRRDRQEAGRLQAVSVPGMEALPVLRDGTSRVSDVQVAILPR